MAVLEFWFDFASTYSYPAALRVEERAAQRGLDLVWRPFLLGPIFAEQGWSDSPFNLYPAKGRYMWLDMQRLCRARSIPFTRPGSFPRNGLLAARLACCFEAEAWLPDFVRAVYRANFADDLDISEPAVIQYCLGCNDANFDAKLARAQSPENKARLREQTARAMQLGIFGAPSFTVGDELFWGNERLEQALDRAAGGRLGEK
ncbi:MAG: 2-hydroxychromene-2-carboxylate isomerase [Wenzhouxiangellaceae bacterium]